MADTEIGGGTLSLIAAPAATDRLVLSTGSATGGYSERGEFIWKDSAGNFNVAGPSGFATLFKNSGDFSRGGSIKVTGAAGDGAVDIGSTSSGYAVTLSIDGTEYSRLSTSGNFGIGTTSPTARLHVKSSSEIMRLETTTVRGGGAAYFAIHDPTGRKGYVGYTGGAEDFYVNNEMTGTLNLQTGGDINFYSGGGLSFFATSSTLRPGVDNARSLGHSSFRWSVVYAGTGTINTSDDRDKTWRGAMNAAELSAARRIAAELGIYQWNDAIAEKGPDGARLHFGVRAQAVWDIMADEGLIDPIAEGVAIDSRYAFLCYDQWPAIDAVEEVRDENDNVIIAGEPARPAGNRFGIRPDQLALFLIAALEARLAALEAA